mmetsp:Transcript_25187/g.42172  ORF Transcript_25187/g.42172 Transcript_25187/m.42172 type:complete len:354 (-) Transcript_25187:97-1158(-)
MLSQLIGSAARSLTTAPTICNGWQRAFGGTASRALPPFSGRSFSTDVSREVSAEEKFLFDTNGYIIVKGVLSPEEVRAANSAIDVHESHFKERKGKLRNTADGTPLAGDGSTGRFDCGGFLEWERPHSTVFRSLLAHQRLLPYLHELCGEGYRLDHSPLLFKQRKGSEGFSLHGGPLTETGAWNPNLQYFYNHGRMYNTLLAVSVALTDTHQGDGGFCIVKGSHKSNFPCPPDMVNGLKHMEHAYQPVVAAGDVVIFTESTFHGTLPWAAEAERRVGLFRFSPATIGYGRAYYPTWPSKMYEEITPEQRAVLEPPYSARLDRPVLQVTGGTSVGRRVGFKKDFDEEVFGTKYF